MEARERAVSILNSLICSHDGKTEMINELVGHLIEAVKEECCSGSQKWEIHADFEERVAPALIQGYTAEQWQEIIDGGYLCEFSGDNSTSFGFLRELEDGKWQFREKVSDDSGGSYWSNCRPAQIKGVMRPMFVEPVYKESSICSFFEDRFPVYTGRWANAAVNGTATSYIEL